MTKTDFINTLDFEVAKKSIARKLGINANELEIKSLKSGDFKIDLKNVSGKMCPLFSGAGRAMIVTDKLNIKEHKDNFSYEATVSLDLKNRSGEYKNKIGKINLDNNKLVFSTIDDIKNNRKSAVNNVNTIKRKRKSKNTNKEELIKTEVV